MNKSARPQPSVVPPPSQHQLAVMIWLAVFPTLTVLNLTFGWWLRSMALLPRTFILATVAVPIVIYGVMPQLHKLRRRLLKRRIDNMPSVVPPVGREHPANLT